MQNKILILLIFLIPSLSLGKDLVNKKVQVKSHGVFHIVSRIAGEPVDARERLTLTLKCNNTKRKVTFFDDQEVCHYLGHELKKNKIVMVINAYNPDTGKCSIPDNKVVNFSKSCSKK